MNINDLGDNILGFCLGNEATDVELLNEENIDGLFVAAFDQLD